MYPQTADAFERTLPLAQVPRFLQVLVRGTPPLAKVLRSLQELMPRTELRDDLLRKHAHRENDISILKAATLRHALFHHSVHG